MKVLNSKAAMIAAGVLAGGLVLYFVGRKFADRAKDAAGAVGRAINPLSDGNLLYRGVNAVGDTLDNGGDDDSWSLGSWFYDLTHKDYDPNEPAQDPDEKTLFERMKEAIL